MSWYDFKPYVPVAQRQAEAARQMAKVVKNGQPVSPVKITGRQMATTFWGQAWCANLEGYSDFANRLPRGRTYARNGSVVHLEIDAGRIKARVSGSELYEIEIGITALPKAQWKSVKERCVGKIGTLVELLQGKLSKAVMEVVTDRANGLFPKPNEIEMECSCPDYAGMCKHIAATMYGVGHRLDTQPELLFRLRGVDHNELIEQAIPTTPIGAAAAPTLAADDLGAIFGIEMDEVSATTVSKPPSAKLKTKKAEVKTTKKIKKHTPKKRAPKKG